MTARARSPARRSHGRGRAPRPAAAHRCPGHWTGARQNLGLAYFLGRDKFLPHQFTLRGDRLAFSVGIVVLGIASSFVLWSFGGSIGRLIPLYAFGVFSAFTRSQAGLVMRWWRRREPGWRRSLAFNGVGALATFLVLLVVATTKFFDGAWMVVVLLPLEVLLFRGIHAHCAQPADELGTGLTIHHRGGFT